MNEKKRAKVRLYVEHPLISGQELDLTSLQANYLFSVMRLKIGSPILVFNKNDGEWLAVIKELSKKRGRLECHIQNRPPSIPADIWLLFSPVKKDRTSLIIEKAVELGVAKICPVITQFTNSERWRTDKQHAHAVEAAEQCGSVFMPELMPIAPLEQVLANWSADRILFWGDEGLAESTSSYSQNTRHINDPFRGTPMPSAILIGPEGGFSSTEKAFLYDQSFVRPLSLGPQILRAETAAISAISLWQNTWGNWKHK